MKFMPKAQRDGLVSLTVKDKGSVQTALHDHLDIENKLIPVDEHAQEFYLQVDLLGHGEDMKELYMSLHDTGADDAELWSYLTKHSCLPRGYQEEKRPTTEEWRDARSWVLHQKPQGFLVASRTKERSETKDRSEPLALYRQRGKMEDVPARMQHHIQRSLERLEDEKDALALYRQRGKMEDVPTCYVTCNACLQIFARDAGSRCPCHLAYYCAKDWTGEREREGRTGVGEGE
jgi:hypothetical protein